MRGRADKDRFGPVGKNIADPDRACLSCLVGLGLLLLSVIAWAIVYYVKNPAFHGR